MRWIFIMLAVIGLVISGCSEDMIVVKSNSNNTVIYNQMNTTGYSGVIQRLKNESITINFIAQSFLLTPTYCNDTFVSGLLVNTSC